jgi:hypothetical protein
MRRRLPMLAIAGLLVSACFGKFTLGVTQSIEPTPVLPGASVRQEVAVDADGLLGSAVKQAMTEAATKGTVQGQTGTQWQIKDNSDGPNVKIRMSRTVGLGEAQQAVAQSSTGGFDVGTIVVRADDWGIARHYAVRVVVSPGKSSPATPSSSQANDATTQQLAKALLAGITYDYFIGLPGFVTSTNGTAADQSRLVWHMDLTSTSERVLVAESIYLDWMRIVLVLVIVALVVAGIWYMRRARQPITIEQPPASTPPPMV